MHKLALKSDIFLIKPITILSAFNREILGAERKRGLQPVLAVLPYQNEAATPAKRLNPVAGSRQRQ
jgi:hypothetical protein